MVIRKYYIYNICKYYMWVYVVLRKYYFIRTQRYTCIDILHFEQKQIIARSNSFILHLKWTSVFVCSDPRKRTHTYTRVIGSSHANGGGNYQHTSHALNYFCKNELYNTVKHKWVTSPWHTESCTRVGCRAKSVFVSYSNWSTFIV